jgi:hypothetical protein
MLKSRELLYFYRILNWENKISGARPIGYTIFGYLMVGSFVFLPLFLNTLAIFGALIFCYGLNDYFDWKIQKEKNFLSEKIKNKELTEKKALVLYCLPLLFFIPFFLIAPTFSLIIFGTGFLLILFYSLAPLRFKKRKILGFILPPIAALLLFLEGYSILGNFNLNIFLLAVLIFIFHCYLEALHVLEDSTVKEETKKIKNTKSVVTLIKTLLIISFVVSLVFSFFNPLFLITSFFSLVRLSTIRKINIIKKIKALRRNIFSFQWSLYEFLIYALLGMLKIF